jgi:hypothetical protein
VDCSEENNGMKDGRRMKRIPLGMLRFVLVFGFGASLALGTGIYPGSGARAASADPHLQQERPGKDERGAATPAPAQPRKVPEKEMPSEQKKMPFKEFVPSERIEPDHAVDFPADI